MSSTDDRSKNLFSHLDGPVETGSAPSGDSVYRLEFSAAPDTVGTDNTTGGDGR
ncbi:hypothetical protein [Nocardia wallacei]|uniref:hypothetical protein n=1 Tax=Nocardia wallacei TaxID=480035 RepID=UPI0024577E1D|nr:hypothetical protein [Nocardia wallacei]